MGWPFCSIYMYRDKHVHLYVKFKKNVYNIYIYNPRDTKMNKYIYIIYILHL